MTDYIAWMGYEDDTEGLQSICRGTLKECKNAAKKTYNSKSWQLFSEGRKTKVKITRGAKQLFVSAYYLV